jgi:hypothetical protein
MPVGRVPLPGLLLVGSLGRISYSYNDRVGAVMASKIRTGFFRVLAGFIGVLGLWAFFSGSDSGEVQNLTLWEKANKDAPVVIIGVVFVVYALSGMAGKFGKKLKMPAGEKSPEGRRSKKSEKDL